MTVIIITIFITACGNDNQAHEREIASYYYAGMFDAVMDLSESNNKYRGMIYEYGLVEGHGVGEAKEVYKEIKDSYASNKRLFLYCFLYCEDELMKYYKNIKGDNLVEALYSLYLIENKGDCLEYTERSVCIEVKEYIRKSQWKDVYYGMGYESYKLMFEERRDNRDFQYPYYLLMKSYVGGNKFSKKFLDSVPNRYSWVPAEIKED